MYSPKAMTPRDSTSITSPKVARDGNSLPVSFRDIMNSPRSDFSRSREVSRTAPIKSSRKRNHNTSQSVNLVSTTNQNNWIVNQLQSIDQVCLPTSNLNITTECFPSEAKEYDNEKKLETNQNRKEDKKEDKKE